MISNIFIKLLSTSIYGQNGEGKLIVKIIGFGSDKGDVIIALFNSKETYSGKELPFKGSLSLIKNKESKIEYDSLSFGIYAIRAFQNENMNDKLDTNFFGLPSEDYGFTNNPSTSFGYSFYEKTTFNFNKNNQIIVIEVD